MKKWRIKYHRDDSTHHAEVQAETVEDARLIFYLSTSCDDILEIEEI